MPPSRVPCLLLSILAVMTPVGSALAQPTPPPPPDPAPPPPMVSVDNSKRLLFTGIGLTAAGVSMGGVSTAVFFHAANGGSSDPYSAIVALFPMVLGGALTLTGIPLWIAGEYDVEVPADDPRAVEERASVSLSVGSMGAGLVGRF